MKCECRRFKTISKDKEINTRVIACRKCGTKKTVPLKRALSYDVVTITKQR